MYWCSVERLGLFSAPDLAHGLPQTLNFGVRVFAVDGRGSMAAQIHAGLFVHAT
jgi:hypothetical protein